MEAGWKANANTNVIRRREEESEEKDETVPDVGTPESCDGKRLHLTDSDRTQTAGKKKEDF